MTIFCCNYEIIVTLLLDFYNSKSKIINFYRKIGGIIWRKIPLYQGFYIQKIVEFSSISLLNTTSMGL